MTEEVKIVPGYKALTNAELLDELCKITQQRNELRDVLRLLKSDLMRNRLGGSDTLASWRNAAVNAERDIEEAIAKAEQ